MTVNGHPFGILDMNVKPRATEVWVNGVRRGTCDDFDGHPEKLRLPAGNHRLKLVTPEGDEIARDIRVRAGVELNVGLDLRSPRRGLPHRTACKRALRPISRHTPNAMSDSP